MSGVDMFDRVRIRSTSLTEEFGYAGKIGLVYGITTPSVTGVEVVGDSDGDAAVAVKFDELVETIWFNPGLIEIVDHAPGTTMRLGSRCYVRSPNGEWIEDDKSAHL